MGRIFLRHIGGTRLFSCSNCDTPLTNRAELISTRFTGKYIQMNCNCPWLSIFFKCTCTSTSLFTWISCTILFKIRRYQIPI